MDFLGTYTLQHLDPLWFWVVGGMVVIIGSVWFGWFMQEFLAGVAAFVVLIAVGLIVYIIADMVYSSTAFEHMREQAGYEKVATESRDFTIVKKLGDDSAQPQLYRMAELKTGSGLYELYVTKDYK